MITPRILCAHESGAVLEELRRALEGAGYAVVQALDGEQAMQSLAHERVDGLVLRYDMEAPDGRALRNQIQRAYPDTPMLLFSDIEEIRNMPLHVLGEYLVHPELQDLALMY
jgi:CheY-like chemotaxis protein